jgi:hypothetical protein
MVHDARYRAPSGGGLLSVDGGWASKRVPHSARDGCVRVLWSSPGLHAGSGGARGAPRTSKKCVHLVLHTPSFAPPRALGRASSATICRTEARPRLRSLLELLPLPSRTCAAVTTVAYHCHEFLRPGACFSGFNSAPAPHITMQRVHFSKQSVGCVGGALYLSHSS